MILEEGSFHGILRVNLPGYQAAMPSKEWKFPCPSSIAEF